MQRIDGEETNVRWDPNLEESQFEKMGRRNRAPLPVSSERTARAAKETQASRKGARRSRKAGVVFTNVVAARSVSWPQVAANPQAPRLLAIVAHEVRRAPNGLAHRAGVLFSGPKFPTAGTTDAP